MQNIKKECNRQSLILSYGFLLSLVTLIINDHWLKQAYPSIITGKLSDFAGLIVLPVLLCLLYPRFFNRVRSLVLLHLVVGLLFALWKLAPVELVTDKLNELVGFTIVSRVKDPTDLIALFSLFISYRMIYQEKTSPLWLDLSQVIRRTVSAAVILVSGIAVMATSSVSPTSNEIECCEGIRGNVDGDGNNEITIADLQILSDFVFNNASRPSCLAEADVNGSGDKNPIREDDVWYLVDYLFKGGPAPLRCPNHAGAS